MEQPLVLLQNMPLICWDSVKHFGVSVLRTMRAFSDSKTAVRATLIYSFCVGAGYMMLAFALVLDLVAGTHVLENVKGANEILLPALQFINGVLGVFVGFSILLHPSPNANMGVNKYCLKRWKISCLPTAKYGSLEESEDEKCCICLGRIGGEEGVRILPNCKHYFHVGCIDRWLLCRNNCPICRSTVYHHS